MIPKASISTQRPSGSIPSAFTIAEKRKKVSKRAKRVQIKQQKYLTHRSSKQRPEALSRVEMEEQVINKSAIDNFVKSILLENPQTTVREIVAKINEENEGYASQGRVKKAVLRYKKKLAEEGMDSGAGDALKKEKGDYLIGGEEKENDRPASNAFGSTEDVLVDSNEKEIDFESSGNDCVAQKHFEEDPGRAYPDPENEDLIEDFCDSTVDQPPIEANFEEKLNEEVSVENIVPRSRRRAAIKSELATKEQLKTFGSHDDDDESEDYALREDTNSESDLISDNESPLDLVTDTGAEPSRFDAVSEILKTPVSSHFDENSALLDTVVSCDINFSHSDKGLLFDNKQPTLAVSHNAQATSEPSNENIESDVLQPLDQSEAAPEVSKLYPDQTSANAEDKTVTKMDNLADSASSHLSSTEPLTSHDGQECTINAEEVERKTPAQANTNSEKYQNLAKSADLIPPMINNQEENASKDPTEFYLGGIDQECTIDSTQLECKKLAQADVELAKPQPMPTSPKSEIVSDILDLKKEVDKEGLQRAKYEESVSSLSAVAAEKSPPKEVQVLDSASPFSVDRVEKPSSENQDSVVSASKLNEHVVNSILSNESQAAEASQRWPASNIDSQSTPVTVLKRRTVSVQRELETANDAVVQQCKFCSIS